MEKSPLAELLLMMAQRATPQFPDPAQQIITGRGPVYSNMDIPKNYPFPIPGMDPNNLAQPTPDRAYRSLVEDLTRGLASGSMAENTDFVAPGSFARNRR